MPRPRKERQVCALPACNRFGPLRHGCFAKADADQGKGPVNMTVDEYETIRLIDLEGLTQEECARQMGIARTTVTGIWNEARRKLAEALVNSRELWIAGGEYALCPYTGGARGRGCRRIRESGTGGDGDGGGLPGMSCRGVRPCPGHPCCPRNEKEREEQ